MYTQTKLTPELEKKLNIIHEVCDNYDVFIDLHEDLTQILVTDVSLNEEFRHQNNIHINENTNGNLELMAKFLFRPIENSTDDVTIDTIEIVHFDNDTEEYELLFRLKNQ